MKSTYELESVISNGIEIRMEKIRGGKFSVRVYDVATGGEVGQGESKELSQAIENCMTDMRERKLNKVASKKPSYSFTAVGHLKSSNTQPIEGFIGKEKPGLPK